MTTYLSIQNIKYPKSKDDTLYLDLLMKLIEIDNALNYISNLPIMPSHAHEIKKEEKIRAIRGTTGIEGNVLDENEIKTLLENNGATSMGQIEVVNSGKVHDFIIEWSLRNPDDKITESLIKQIHKINTEGLPYPSNEPGKYRNFEVTYGYPPKKTPLKTESDIQIEMKKLIDWLNDENSVVFPYSIWIIKGVLTHYAISRMHPFADGNGRTARAIEALIFCHKAKINDYCFYGISNYCYRNRDAYIEELSKVDISGDASNFLMFCIKGFHESILYVKDRITNVISELMFMDYVHSLRRQKKIPQKAVEVIDLFVRLKSISYNDYYKSFFSNRTDESKRRYLKKFMELHLINIVEKDKMRFILPNLDVLKTLRRIV
jgi:Fic family protein